MHCVVTGAAGFIGSTICDRLLALGHTVCGLDCFIDYYPKEMKLKNLEQAKSNANFKFIEGNLLTEDLSRLLDGAEWIFHQAAQAGVRASWGQNFATYTDNNILATQRLLEATKQEAIRKSLKKVVYASSSSVYGHAESLPTLEETRPQPISPYGVTKLAAEHLMVLYAKEFSVPTVSLRYFTVYGPRQRPDMAFHRFIRQALSNEPITLYGDGEQSRDFTFIADIVEANLRSAQSGSETDGMVFNIGGGSRVTVNEMIAKLERILNRQIAINRFPREAGDAKHTGADTTRAVKHLGFKPTVGLEEGLAAEAKWLDGLMRA